MNEAKVSLTAQECRMARAALAIGVRDLATCADVSPNTIARLERGETLHRRTLAHVRGVLEALGVIFVTGGSGIWPGPVVGYAKPDGKSLSGRAKLFSDLWNLPRSFWLQPATAYAGLLDIFEGYLDVIQSEGREPDTWERLNLNHAANDFERSKVHSAYASIRVGVTPPDNQGKDYPIAAEDVASVASCDLAYFRKAVVHLRSKGYIERYPKEAASAS